MALTKAESILAIDIGAAFTKTALFGVVDGEYRFLAASEAPSTQAAPSLDVTKGVIEAIRRLETVAGQVILGPHGVITPQQTDSRGVDDCFVVSSAGSPLRTLVVAATAQQAGEVAAQVAATPGVVLVGKGSIDAKLAKGESHLRLILAALEQQRPHVVVVSENGAHNVGFGELVQALTIRSRTKATQSGNPSVLFLGSEDGSAKLRAALPDTINLYGITREGASGSALQEHLTALWQESWLAEVPGGGALDFLPRSLPMPAALGFANALRLIESGRNSGIWGLDIGAESSTAIALLRNSIAIYSQPQLGAGQGSKSFLGRIDSVEKWMAPNTDPSEVRRTLFAKQLHPSSVPETAFEMAVDSALAREVASIVLERLPARHSKDGEFGGMVIGRGAVFSNFTGLGDAILQLLDCFQPLGLVELTIDRLGILPMLGALAAYEPDAATALVAREGLERLATCIALTGEGKKDAEAAKVTVERGKQREAIKVSFGEIRLLPLEGDATAKITVRPAGKFDCGLGPGRKATFEVRGGAAGIVIDARGRLRLPDAQADWAALAAQWRDSLGA